MKIILANRPDAAYSQSSYHKTAGVSHPPNTTKQKEPKTVRWLDLLSSPGKNPLKPFTGSLTK
jgi:hypothetical protein